MTLGGAVICSDPGGYWGKLSKGHATPKSPEKHVTAASLGCLSSEKMKTFPNLSCRDAYEEITHSLFLFIVCTVFFFFLLNILPHSSQ